MSKYTVYRIDPERRVILRLEWPAFKKHYHSRVAKAIQSEHIAFQHLMDVDGQRLMVSAAQHLEDDVPGFKIRGTSQDKVTVGRGLIHGLGVNKGFVGSPVDLNWLRTMIVWLTPEECVPIVSEEDLAND